MGELRKDYVCDSWVLISPIRAKRPSDFKQLPIPPTPADLCFFCPGKESSTPPEIGRIGQPWTMRWFNNKFPATEPLGEAAIKTDNTFFTFSNNYGIHEIIVETQNHGEQLVDLPRENIAQLLSLYITRLHALSTQPNIVYVMVFKNHGPHAGTSIYHSHSQIISINFIPPYIRDLHYRSMQGETCLFCDVLASEQNGIRLIRDKLQAISFTPYASQFGFEAWIFPKRHHGYHPDNHLGFSEPEYLDMADCLKQILTGLARLNVSYNVAFVYGPPQLHIHPHLRILPRIGVWGGFELGSRVIINGVTPEQAAAYYRDPHD